MYTDGNVARGGKVGWKLLWQSSKLSVLRDGHHQYLSAPSYPRPPVHVPARRLVVLSHPQISGHRRRYCTA